jgi:hypothetical protein
MERIMTETFEIAGGQGDYADLAKDDLPPAAERLPTGAVKAKKLTRSASIARKGDATGRLTDALEAKAFMPVASHPLLPAGGEAIAKMHESATHPLPSPNPPRKRRQKAKSTMRESAIWRMPSDDNSPGEAALFMRESASPCTPTGGSLSEIIDLSKTRRQWQQASNRLYLHALSMCRSYCNGDKGEAVKLYKATASGDDIRLHSLIGPFIDDIERWDARIAVIEKRILPLMKDIPIGDYIAKTKGLGPMSMATMISHTGGFDQYATIAKLWRRLGLAVSEDGSARGSLIIPGIADYRPRRAAAYVVGSGLMKAGNPEFRAVYDREKLKALGKDWTKARAHNHAMRVGTKWAIKQMWKAWEPKP